ncbi:L-lactate permease [Aestuariibacter sp. A3R04]|uniref:L-lactate permease n=1 Tax=Aestuariibacter sp. A3R04 TaxID=2841571 RepID=UPI001C0A5375|nr:L-lactate permease [Aestuariibacter sp. A3R04]MBU3023795.1 L-lactate permease [Aestuariibacter sp. A3R04]
MPSILFAYFPIVLLVVLMSKKNSMAASRALPLCAFVAYLVVIFAWHYNLTWVNANVLSGLLTALTPISIIAGAIFLFKCMEVTGALNTIRARLNRVSQNPVAQLMIIGWAFAFLIEGASGFGTPAAIAAPILMSLGFPALRVAVFCLIMNSIPVSFGAVGTPIWFGLSVVDLSAQALSEISVKAAVINTVAAPFVVFAGLAFVVRPLNLLWKNALFVVLSVLSCTLPYLLLSMVSTEFPSLIGGAIGLFITLVLAHYNVGLHCVEMSTTQHPNSESGELSLIKAGFPLWGTVVMLIITRIHQFGIKGILQATSPSADLSLGYLGQFSVSASLVLSLKGIFHTAANWQHSLLYVPSILPFLVMGLATLWLYRVKEAGKVFADTAVRMKQPVLALFGALVFVNIMMLSNNTDNNSVSAVEQIGKHLASLTGSKWDFFAAFLGALGSFFSGSATISNLTFAAIQASIASQLGLSVTTILAMQSVGAAMGNMVCINNIVAVTSILALNKQDGEILTKTVWVMLLYGTIAGVSGVLFF